MDGGLVRVGRGRFVSWIILLLCRLAVTGLGFFGMIGGFIVRIRCVLSLLLIILAYLIA